jgi:glycosyltransferase involved in cell wall biosynthesis
MRGSGFGWANRGYYSWVRIAVIPGDETGCGTYRMILPANAVQKVRPDWSVELYKPGTVKVASDQQGRAIGLKGMADPDKIDVLVMQRIGTRATLGFTDWARDHGIATVIDADDAMWCIDKNNAAYRSWNNQQMNWKFLDQATERADLVTVTSPHLAKRYGKHGRVEIISNYLPAEVFDYERVVRNDDITAVGWTGFVSTHPRDLNVVGDAMRRITEDTEAVARVIGDGRGAAKVWGVKTMEQIDPQPLGPAYFTALSTLNVGLVPLEDSNFNRGKSWLKALEFSAMGVPVVASPTVENLRLAREGGVPLLFATTPDEWYENIRWLVEHPYKREQQGEAARAAVQKNFTMESVGERWAAAWERAYARRERIS